MKKKQSKLKRMSFRVCPWFIFTTKYVVRIAEGNFGKFRDELPILLLIDGESYILKNELQEVRGC